jgi:X-X-X-Leu-X-X-Gly heptad repeat protein
VIKQHDLSAHTGNSTAHKKDRRGNFYKLPLAALLTVALTGALLISPTATVTAAPSPIQKDENVFAILATDGSLKSAYIVNDYEPSAPQLEDYGDYTGVTNLTDDKYIALEGDKVSSHDAVTSYEGVLDTAKAKKAFPWNVSITYTLDGKKQDASQLAGKSGAIKINIKADKNESADALFYDHYALQISLSLNKEKCTSITAKDATIVNAGADKTLSFNKMPGKSADYTIEFTATDFEMGAISLNAVPLSMTLDTSEFDKMTDEFKPLTDAITKLADGSSELSNGAKQLQTGLDRLATEGVTLRKGSSDILSALKQIADNLKGIDQLTAEIGKVEQLKTGSDAFKQGLQQVNEGLKQLGKDDEQTQQLLAYIQQAYAQDPSVMGLLQLYNGKMQALNQQLSPALDQLNTSYTQINDGITAIATSIAQLSKLQELVTGLNTLATEYAKFDTGIQAYTGGIVDVKSGYTKIQSAITQLSDGLNTMKNETSGIDTQVKDKITAAVDSFTGGTYEIKSFASPKNTNTASVQFIMRTDSITIPEKPAENKQEAPKKNVWEKLLELFGL